MLILAHRCRVRRIGGSLSVYVPVFMAEIIRRRHGEFYAYVEDGGITYSPRPPRARHKRVKLRVQARYKDRKYYVLTVPATLATELGLADGSTVALYYDGEKIRVVPATPEEVG
ncbi:MAG: hypothetical protein DRJ67_12420 [Thermoprotei archaeon]|nr:MAG: hypothetical protein DRJ67_12420 [Thermoprotei archaeon]